MEVMDVATIDVELHALMQAVDSVDGVETEMRGNAWVVKRNGFIVGNDEGELVFPIHADKETFDQIVSSLQQTGVLPMAETATPPQEGEKRRGFQREEIARGHAVLAENQAKRRKEMVAVGNRLRRIAREAGIFKEPKKGQGGWRGSIAEMGRVFQEWQHQQGTTPMRDAEAARMFRDYVFKKGETSHGPTIERLREFADHLERRGPEKAVREYEKLKASYMERWQVWIAAVRTGGRKGMSAGGKDTVQVFEYTPPTQEPPAEELRDAALAPEPEEPEATEPTEPTGDQNGAVHYLATAPVGEKPQLAALVGSEDSQFAALDALAIMARRAETDHELNRSVKVAERILGLELERVGRVEEREVPAT
jgi:hypothetical protein